MSAPNNRIFREARIERELRRSSDRLPALVQRSGSHVALTPANGQKHSWKSAFGAMAVLAAVTAGVGYYHPWSLSRSAAAQSHAEVAPKVVTAVSPAPATTSNVVLPATFRAWQNAALYARVSGYLAAWHRDLGSPVKAGEVLAEIETPELDQELAEAQATASEAAAAAVQAQAERSEAQADLKVAEAQLARVRADYELARSQLVRRDSLFKSRAIAQEEYDTFQRQVEARAAEVAAAQSDLARRRANLETRAAIILAREAAANSRRANVDRLQELQVFKRIVAPFDGVITSRTAEVGMLVTAGKEALFVLEDLSRIRVQLNVPQTYAMQTAPGVLATISLPESNVPPVRAEITRVADSVDSNSRTMLAEIELANGQHHFQPGSYAQVTLAAPQSGTQWTIATNAISMRVNGPHVAVVNDHNEIEIRPVTLGRDLGNRVVVAEGIQGKERLVVNPSDDLEDGVQVEVRRGPEA
jgi:multidrug efflux pump subunit AcrA (membrane-fusion protein)